MLTMKSLINSKIKIKKKYKNEVVICKKKFYKGNILNT